MVYTVAYLSRATFDLQPKRSNKPKKDKKQTGFETSFVARDQVGGYNVMDAPYKAYGHKQHDPLICRHL